MKEEFFEKIEKTFALNGFQLSQQQKEEFFNYFKLLIDWNNKFNLTAITQENEVIKKHFLDSAVCFDMLTDNLKMIDIGSGAGFPSVPLKILKPDLEITMIDSVNKKVTFLNELINILNLKDSKAFHERAEDMAYKKEFRESFDICVSRAVASLNTLVEYCLPFLRIGGKMLAYKSSEINEELDLSKNAITILGGKIDKIKTLTIDGVERKIVIIKKIQATPNKYPRTGNKPRLMPL